MDSGLRGAGVVHGYRGTGVVEVFNGFRRSTGVQTYMRCRGLV